MQEININEIKNPEYVLVGNKKMKLDDLINDYVELKYSNKKALKKYLQEQQLKPYQAELIKLQNYLEENSVRMVVLFEGRDAAGKGGTIRRIVRYMNEKHYRVVALGKPSDVQKTQWYFQRYVEQFPRGGEMVLFDRSWYNRAMVEPVFGFCTQQQYETFIEECPMFEKSLVMEGTILVKIYLSISKEEQAKRFEKRRRDPLRQWKLSEIDLQAQDKWDEFTEMKYKMLKATHTHYAPWTVIRSDDKHLARLNAMKVILNAVDYKERNNELNYVPDEGIVVSGAREIEIMEADRIRSGKFVS
ncbi:MULTISPECIES: polyphosphate kinase 2 [unclassified Lebetimonas]|jgi:polyphosphate kinase 2|uniref:polyphosphate kinase 2 n=1 Tax=unclassified Lebetimonas TaxID=2648158 RepID=UPI0004639E1C|nr:MULTISPECIES: polyphosphate kinase 2 [unclassified Lebetimonas]